MKIPVETMGEHDLKMYIMFFVKHICAMYKSKIDRIFKVCQNRLSSCGFA
jgi:hypothetical protein